MEQAGVDVSAVLVFLLEDGLASVLPFRALCRVYGAFLAEGSEVILRYALALLKLAGPSLSACKTTADAKAVLQEQAEKLSRSPQDLDNFTKAAFAQKLSEGRRRMSSTMVSDIISPTTNLSGIFCRPRLFEPRGRCPDDLWVATWPRVHELCRALDPHLVYTPNDQGRSLRSVLSICKNHARDPMVFFVYSAVGDILG